VIITPKKWSEKSFKKLFNKLKEIVALEKFFALYDGNFNKTVSDEGTVEYWKLDSTPLIHAQVTDEIWVCRNQHKINATFLSLKTKQCCATFPTLIKQLLIKKI
jgi:hypothetical protein